MYIHNWFLKTYLHILPNYKTICWFINVVIQATFKQTQWLWKIVCIWQIITFIGYWEFVWFSCSQHVQWHTVLRFSSFHKHQNYAENDDVWNGLSVNRSCGWLRKLSNMCEWCHDERSNNARSEFRSWLWVVAESLFASWKTALLRCETYVVRDERVPR